MANQAHSTRKVKACCVSQILYGGRPDLKSGKTFWDEALAWTKTDVSNRVNLEQVSSYSEPMLLSMN